MSEQPGRPVIVVGIDGSDLSVDALRWAVGQARLTGAEVNAVLAWDIPVGYYPMLAFEDADFQADGQEIVDRAVAQVLPGAGDVPISTRVIRLQPRAALVEAARGAALLVVGSHGIGTLPGLHLGSIASYCVHHAPCPVLVYRTSATGR